jgi:hypothetical protein
MSKYYYLTAQLPGLKISGPLPMSEDDFLQETKKWIPDKYFCILKQTEINNFTGVKKEEPRALQRFKGFEYYLRNEILQFRQARRQHKEYKTKGEIKEALSLAGPLEIEKKLLKMRWDFLEEEEAQYHFDVNYLVNYFLKMKIIKRLQSFDKQKGVKEFEKLSLPESGV